MKSYQKRNQLVLNFIVNIIYYVHNGRIFVPVKVTLDIVGYKFHNFVNCKK